MGTLYLVRHAQASLGADDYDQLSELGRRQSIRLGEHFASRGLRFDALLTGTLRRHHQTLDGILHGMGQSGARLSWPGLNEYDFDAVIAAVHPQPRPRPVTPEAVRQHFRLLRQGLTGWMSGELQPAGMVSFADFSAGIARAMTHAQTHHPDGNVLIVSSGGTIGAAIGHVLGTPPATTIELNLRMRNTSVSEVAFTGQRLSLLSFNGIPHLESAPWADAVTYA